MTKAQNHITVFELAECSNLTPRRIQQFIEDGIIHPPVKGKLNRLDALRRLFKWHQRDGEETRREKLLLTSATRKTKELEYGILADRYIERGEATSTVVGCSRIINAALQRELMRKWPATRREKLVALGAAPELIGDFYSWDVQEGTESVCRIIRDIHATGKLTERALAPKEENVTTNKENQI
jgi:hypothetical protein